MLMKKTLLIATLTVAFASSSALASDKETKDAKETKTATAASVKEKAKAVAAQKREVALTGSNIKRVVRKDGQVTDGPNSLTIIDQKTIERSGAADVRQVLARQSSFR
jgi:outer membrane receptor for monomeric catechols